MKNNWRQIALIFACLFMIVKIVLTQSVGEEDIKIFHEIIDAASSS